MVGQKIGAKYGMTIGKTRKEMTFTKWEKLAMVIAPYYQLKKVHLKLGSTFLGPSLWPV